MVDNKSKSKKQLSFVIMRRELKSYFSGPIAYIVSGLFLIITGIVFFSTFFLQGRAELRSFFSLMPLLLSFFVPALSMRVFSEEKRNGSYETLLTLPVTEFQVVMGKFLAVFIEVLIMFVPTLFYVVTAAVFGNPDYGPIIGGYMGLVFLSASFSAIGIFASSVTKNQIISFFTAWLICIALTMIDTFLVFLPSSIVEFISYLSASAHFSSISKGIIDTRDLVYFISLTALFFTLTVRANKVSKE